MILEEYTVIYSVSNPACIPGTYQCGMAYNPCHSRFEVKKADETTSHSDVNIFGFDCDGATAAHSVTSARPFGG
jgi:hypothetical protein